MSTPAGQPSRMIEEIEKTKPSVTPPESIPSTGTGKRSASAMLANRPSSAATSPAERGASAYRYAANPTAPVPATTTGATTANTLAGIAAGADTAAPYRARPARTGFGPAKAGR